MNREKFPEKVSTSVLGIIVWQLLYTSAHFLLESLSNVLPIDPIYLCQSAPNQHMTH
jgi:hypothetical protein